MKDIWDLPSNATIWGVCKKCGRTTWVRTETHLCTEPPRGCHWKITTAPASRPRPGGRRRG